VAICANPKTGACQQKKTEFDRSAIYLELLGPGLLYSINYDFRVTQNWGLRAGFSDWTVPGIFALTSGELGFAGFPITVNCLLGHGSNHLELGAGVVPAVVTLNGNFFFVGPYINGRKSILLETATVGYRYQPTDGGFVFRICFTPILNKMERSSIQEDYP